MKKEESKVIETPKIKEGEYYFFFDFEKEGTDEMVYAMQTGRDISGNEVP